jgi:hypothetical protein
MPMLTFHVDPCVSKRGARIASAALCLLLWGLTAPACGGDDTPPVDAGVDRGEVDAGDVDAGEGEDAGDVDASEGVDAGDVDAGEGVDAGDVDAGEGVDAGDVDAGEGVDAGDAGGADGGGRPDSGEVDAGDAGGADGGGRPDLGEGDAGPMCGGGTSGWCAETGLSCECCPAGGPRSNCLCTTTCRDDRECTDPARPRCNRDLVLGSMGICTPRDFLCLWGAPCASPDTLVATPDGERPIATLRPGDLVISLDRGELRAVPLLAVHRQPVTGHRVVRITLSTGRVVEMSERHPTVDGRPFASLAPGEWLGDPVAGARIVALELIPYAHDATYDILPDSDTGSYVAAGALVGTTMRR